MEEFDPLMPHFSANEIHFLSKVPQRDLTRDKMLLGLESNNSELGLGSLKWYCILKCGSVDMFWRVNILPVIDISLDISLEILFNSYFCWWPFDFSIFWLWFGLFFFFFSATILNRGAMQTASGVKKSELHAVVCGGVWIDLSGQVKWQIYTAGRAYMEIVFFLQTDELKASPSRRTMFTAILKRLQSFICTFYFINFTLLSILH